jgi:dUTP pyrophosphatase
MDIIQLPNYKGLELPKFQSKRAAGIDLRAAFGNPDDPDDESNTVSLNPGDDIVIPTGLLFDMASHPYLLVDGLVNVYGCVLPRSGLGFKHYVRLANTAGVIDSDFQGEIMVKVRNESKLLPLVIKRGDRICQMVFHLCLSPFEFNVVDEFKTESERGAGGLGSSGVQ